MRIAGYQPWKKISDTVLAISVVQDILINKHCDDAMREQQ